MELLWSQLFVDTDSPSLCFPCGSAVKESACNVGDNPWVGKIPWRRERLLTPLFWPREFQGLYSPWGRKELDTAEWLTLSFRPSLESYDKPRWWIEYITLLTCPSSQSYSFSSSHVWMWASDHKKGWVPKNWCLQTVELGKTPESPLDCKEIKPVNPKGNQYWIFIGRTDAKAEPPVLCPPHVKSWLIGKDSNAGRDWGQEEKGKTEDEMAGWHHQLDGHEFE